MDQIMKEGTERLKKLRTENFLGGGEKALERQRSLGKLPARERIDHFYDPDTFQELGSVVKSTGIRIDGKVNVTPADGAIVGTGKVNGRAVAMYASDFSVQAGSMATQHIQKFFYITGWAGKWGIPIVWFLDSAGGRLGEYDIPSVGVEWFFYYESRFSGVVPQVHVLLGPCVAGQAYAPCLCDFLIMVRGTSNLWLGGPRLTSSATSEDMDSEVGSADYHMKLTGSVDYVAVNDRHAIEIARKLLSYLPSNYRENPPVVDLVGENSCRDIFEICDIVPGDISRKYDMHDVIRVIVDNGDYLELKDEYARSLITCFARINGHSVGIVANNPREPGGILERNCCDKYYRFLSVLDAYNVPLISLVDTPLYIPGEEEEKLGLLRHGGKIIDLYATATIPKISVVLRQAYGDAGAFIMGVSKSMGADICYGWPNAVLAVEISEMNIHKAYEGGGVEEDAYESYLGKVRERVSVFDVGNTWTTNVIDEVIDPSETRKKIIEALEVTKNKQETLPVFPKSKKGHGAPPV